MRKQGKRQIPSSTGTILIRWSILLETWKCFCPTFLWVALVWPQRHTLFHGNQHRRLGPLSHVPSSMPASFLLGLWAPQRWGWDPSLKEEVKQRGAKVLCWLNQKGAVLEREVVLTISDFLVARVSWAWDQSMGRMILYLKKRGPRNKGAGKAVFKRGTPAVGLTKTSRRTPKPDTEF